MWYEMWYTEMLLTLVLCGIGLGLFCKLLCWLGGRE